MVGQRQLLLKVLDLLSGGSIFRRLQIPWYYGQGWNVWANGIFFLKSYLQYISGILYCLYTCPLPKLNIMKNSLLLIIIYFQL